MNSIAIGPLVFANDRFAAVLTILTFLLVSEIVTWRRPDARDAIRRWSGAALLIWIVTARLGFVITHWEGFAPAPLSVFAIWQGGFDIRAGTFGLGATLFTAFLRQSRVGFSVLISVLAASATFSLATLLLPDDTRGRVPGDAFAALAGGAVTLDAREGQPLVLNLWATWCPPCRREMPMMVDLAQTQVGVDMIFANQGEPEQIIRTYLDMSHLPADGMIQDPTSSLMQKFGLLGLPSTLFFAADGSLQAVHTGEISRAALLAGIADLKKAGK